MHSWRTRSALRGALGIVVISLVAVACGTGATTAPEPTAGPTDGSTPEPTAAPTALPTDIEGSLSVLDWSGYDAEDFWTDFASTYTNVDVAFEFGISDADIYGK